MRPAEPKEPEDYNSLPDGRRSFHFDSIPKNLKINKKQNITSIHFNPGVSTFIHPKKGLTPVPPLISAANNQNISISPQKVPWKHPNRLNRFPPTLKSAEYITMMVFLSISMPWHFWIQCMLWYTVFLYRAPVQARYMNKNVCSLIYPGQNNQEKCSTIIDEVEQKI